MNDVWNQLHDLFDTDEGFLAEIWIENLSDVGLEKVFMLFCTSGSMLPGAYFWHNREAQEQLVEAVSNIVRLVISGEAAPFHVVFRGLFFGGATIPDIGVFVAPNQIILDYRPGPMWGPAELIALLELLKKVHELEPGALIYLDKRMTQRIRERFEIALQNHFYRKIVGGQNGIV